MNCEQASVVAALAASGDATPAEICGFNAHVAVCAACHAEAIGFEVLREQLRAMQTAVLPDFAYAVVRARVASEINVGKRRRWVLAGSSLLVMAASFIAAFTLHRTVPIEVRKAPAEAVVIAAIPAPPAPHRIRTAVRHTAPREPEAPIVVKMFTSDPDVIIYWVADAKVQSSKKEIMQ